MKNKCALLIQTRARAHTHTHIHVQGAYSVHESNIFNILTVDTINPAYVLASFLTPISWGLHVAAWIQKQNGK